MPGPLEGVRVIEIADDLAGAFAGQILADEGAEVVKVEPPEGDPLRHHEPYANGESRLFQSVNRGKRSVVLNTARPEARDTLQRLVADSDVLLTTASDRRLTELGLAGGEWADRAPRLVRVLVSTLGEHGSLADAPLGPLCLQAFSGLLAGEGKVLPDGAPAAIASTDMVERATGIFAALGTSAALLRRLRTGRGETVTTSKLAVAVFLQGGRTVDIPAADSSARPNARERIRAVRERGGSFAELVAARAPSSALPNQVFYRAYNTLDGAVFIGALSAPLRARARRAMETDFLHRDDPDWDPRDPEFVAACNERQAEIEAAMSSRTTAEWIARCEAEKVPVGEVVFPEDLADSEQARANELMIRVEHPTAGPQLQAAPFIRFHRHAPPRPGGAPPFSPDGNRDSS